MTEVLIKMGNLHTQTQGEHHMKMRAMPPQTKEAPEAEREAKEKILP